MRAGIQAGRVALISGGGRGIGAAISLALAADGADIAINYNRDEAAAQATAAQVRALGRNVRLYRASIADDAACAALVGSVVKDFGRLDILINNAGIASRGNTVELSPVTEIEKLMRVHVFGAYSLTHYALPHLKRAGRGDVIMISSSATQRLLPNQAPYTMAKAALEALAVTLAKEINMDGIRVNVVAPALTVTEMGRRLAKATAGVSEITELDRQSPFEHVCTPEEVADVVAFLTSPRNGYVSGQVVYVDGAYTGMPAPARTVS
jgi:NAD(P)-dependent dehydrogenase (short-subunit alcohol dehydrogenase family)